ncbi:hypothetical protein ACWCQS_32950 [Streptomyces sp. NPDC002076]
MRHEENRCLLLLVQELKKNVMKHVSHSQKAPHVARVRRRILSLAIAAALAAPFLSIVEPSWATESRSLATGSTATSEVAPGDLIWG